MNIELIIPLLIISLLIFILLQPFREQRKSTIKNEIAYKNEIINKIENENEFTIKIISRIPKNNQEIIPEIRLKKDTKPPEKTLQEIRKNKWLYPEDNFGKMKRGKVYSN